MDFKTNFVCPILTLDWTALCEWRHVAINENTHIVIYCAPVFCDMYISGVGSRLSTFVQEFVELSVSPL